MGKFNETKRGYNTKPDTTNVAGMSAFSRDDIKKEIASVILNSMLNGDSYYEKEKDRIEKISKYISDNQELSEFIAKAMVYTRTEGNLRSVSHLIGTVLAENAKGTSFLKNALYKSMIRPDDATEMVALWNSRNNKSIPNSMRRAIKKALEQRFDGYQLKKYYGTGAVKVSNLINIAHPKPRDEYQKEIFKMVLENRLPNIDTAQTVNASGTENRAEKYEAMLSEGKMGYMAVLKNLKNILEAEPSDNVIEMIVEVLTNKNRVLKSRILPFRFMQAYEAVEIISMDKFKRNKILKAIEQGFIYSAGNIPIVEEGEKVAILLDESGSMGGMWSKSIQKTPFYIGKVLMASMLTGLDKDNTIGYLWADNVREVNINQSPMTFMKNMHTRGGGTNLGQAITDLINTKTVVDKIVIFTDMQENSIGGYWGGKRFSEMVKDYKKINPNVKILFWNLEGYAGGTPLKMSDNVLEVNGYSDSILKVVSKIWEDKDALIKEIENISLEV